ncbi:HTH domain-containing protein [Alkalicella caledoniensis]|uniref:HTH domain-containing protein n=1 Tax=Alkalicella caledoniensis TaxID=2731377 RepID=A0A7G9W6Y7_ALKCA|nr:HTH domain-containing protein [Alkalicella caledoniensis]QNO14449.1 HTH domain-containing protein [Alkalicella caledoniensis]
MDTATEVLKLFLENPKENISGQYISERLGISRNAVWKGIEQLRKSGYIIEGITNKGYVISRFPTDVDKHYLQVKLSSFWKEIIVVDSIDSTNIQLKKLADQEQDQNQEQDQDQEQGKKRGTIFIAKEQTKGKGRLGRQWNSQSGGL